MKYRHSFLICFNEGYSDVYVSGVFIGRISDGVFVQHSDIDKIANLDVDKNTLLATVRMSVDRIKQSTDGS